MGISDIRGIENALQLELNGQRLDFVPAPLSVGWVRACTCCYRPWTRRRAPRLDFAFDLRLQGTGQLQVLPVGKTSNV